MPKIVYDRESCSGFFSCVKVSDDFIEGDEDKSILVDGTETSEDLFEKEIGEDQLEDAIEAANVCPVDVIKVLDDDGKVIAGPDKLPVER